MKPCWSTLAVPKIVEPAKPTKVDVPSFVFDIKGLALMIFKVALAVRATSTPYSEDIYDEPVELLNPVGLSPTVFKKQYKPRLLRTSHCNELMAQIPVLVNVDTEPTL